MFVRFLIAIRDFKHQQQEPQQERGNAKENPNNVQCMSGGKNLDVLLRDLAAFK